LILDPVTSIEQNLEVPKNTQQELLDQVEKDLEQALTSRLPATNFLQKDVLPNMQAMHCKQKCTCGVKNTSRLPMQQKNMEG
jgi:hypothetical protein